MSKQYGYELNYEWKHPWPRAPTPSNEQARLDELAKYQIVDSEQDDKFDKLCRIACKEMKCPIAAVSFIDKTRQWFKANSGLTQRQIPRDVALCAHTIMRPKHALIVEDTSQDERFAHNPLVTRASAVRFYAGVPITTPNGYCIGSVFVFDVKPHSNADARILHKIAAKVLKYMDERSKTLEKDTPTKSNEKKASSHSSLKEKEVSEPEPEAPVKAKTVASSPVEMSEDYQSPGEPSLNENGQSTQQESSALVQSNGGAQEQQMEVSDQGNSLGNMGSMLMNLLARTTETQQQLAAQQGVMFETLGQHTSQLDSLGQSMDRLEQRFEQAKMKKRGVNPI